MVPDPAGTVIHRWRPASEDPEVAALCRQVVTEAAPHSPARAKAYLLAAGRIGTFARSKGLLLTAEVCLCEAVAERYVATGGARLAPAALRTVRSNLRALRPQVLGGPQPALIGRERDRAPDSPAEIARYLALCDAQPTVARRQRATGLVCLGAGAGLVGGDVRCVRGHDGEERSGRVVVEVRYRAMAEELAMMLYEGRTPTIGWYRRRLRPVEPAMPVELGISVGWGKRGIAERPLPAALGSNRMGADSGQASLRWNAARPDDTRSRAGAAEESVRGATEKGPTKSSRLPCMWLPDRLIS